LSRCVVRTGSAYDSFSHTESFTMLSNGNLSQYLPQGSPQFGLQGMFGPAGAYGGNPGFGPELAYQHGSAHQQIPFGNSFAAGAGNPGAGPQIIWALGLLAQQVAAQGVVAQQLGAALSQLAQHVATQILQGGVGNASGGISAGQSFGNPHLGNPAFNGTGAGAQSFGSPQGQNPFAGGMQGFGSFAAQNPGWGSNRPAMN
jgi:hypothetical protein